MSHKKQFVFVSNILTRESAARNGQFGSVRIFKQVIICIIGRTKVYGTVHF